MSVSRHRLRQGKKFRKLKEVMWLTVIKEICSLSCKAGSLAQVTGYFLTMSYNKHI